MEGRQSGGRGNLIRREEVIKDSFTVRIRDKGQLLLSSATVPAESAPFVRRLRHFWLGPL